MDNIYEYVVKGNTHYVRAHSKLEARSKINAAAAKATGTPGLDLGIPTSCTAIVFRPGDKLPGLVVM